MIKFLDLKAINDSFVPELSLAVKRVLNSGWYLLGNEVNAFEQEYAKYIGAKHCIGVANGLDALRLILKAFIELEIMHEGEAADGSVAAPLVATKFVRLISDEKAEGIACAVGEVDMTTNWQ